MCVSCAFSTWVTIVFIFKNNYISKTATCTRHLLPLLASSPRYRQAMPTAQDPKVSAPMTPHSNPMSSQALAREGAGGSSQHLSEPPSFSCASGFSPASPPHPTPTTCLHFFLSSHPNPKPLLKTLLPLLLPLSHSSPLWSQLAPSHPAAPYPNIPA